MLLIQLHIVIVVFFCVLTKEKTWHGRIIVITRIEGCMQCGSNDRHLNHMKHHVKFTNACNGKSSANYDRGSARFRGMQKGMPFTLYAVLYLTTFPDVDRSKF